MKINKIYLDRFKKVNYGYLFMIKRGIFLLFDKDTLIFKGLLNMYPYKEGKEFEDTIKRLVALDYLEV